MCAGSVEVARGSYPTTARTGSSTALEELSGIFAVSVAAFSVLDDRVQLVLRLDPDVARRWSNEASSGGAPALSTTRQISASAAGHRPLGQRQAATRLGAVATAREQLQSLGWFMKCLKEPLARLANRQDQAREAFFEGRFKSVAILDDESLLTACAYIDLNPVAAGIAQSPQTSPHTSIKQRVRARQGSGTNRRLGRRRRTGARRARQCAAGIEDSLWLCPIEDRRELDSAREGMLEGFSLGELPAPGRLHGRLFRDEKADDRARSGRDL